MQVLTTALLLHVSARAHSATPSTTTDGAAAASGKPHILHVIVDDFGWANTNYHRAEPTPEVVTPRMDSLVKEGVMLMRHYVHPECTPTRVSFQTGRIPMHSGQGGLCSPGDESCGAPYDMGTIAEKMVEGGMQAHFVGKWDVGMATPTHVPHGRGYNTSLNYFGHGNYQWGMVEWGADRASRLSGRTPSADGEFIRDLYDTDRPAAAQANRSRDEGIYEEMIFRERLYSIVMHHEPTVPLFLTYCARIAHYPIQAPAEYQHRPHIAKIDVPHRLVYHAQVEFLDEQLGNLTDMLKVRGMWNQTLMVLSSDNGGYTKSLGPCTDGSDPVRGITCMSGEAGANNYPMRGGKYSLFEGGIRANSFVSGGFLPQAVRGTVLHGLLHISDCALDCYSLTSRPASGVEVRYSFSAFVLLCVMLAGWATYCSLLGVDPTDTKATKSSGYLPPISSLNMWPMISGQNLTSPRQELFVTGDLLIQGDWKLITGRASSASWPGPTYPNATSVNNTLDRYTADCSAGPDWAEDYNEEVNGTESAAGPCLYNVGNSALGDWTEHQNLAAAYPDIVKTMMARLVELRPSIWSNPNGAVAYKKACLNTDYVWWTLSGGFYGPWCEVGPGPAPPIPTPRPGNFTPTPLSNCTYVPGTWIYPASQDYVQGAGTKEACCRSCGLSPTCVAAVLNCPLPSGPCKCNLKHWNAENSLRKDGGEHTHADMACLSGRQHISGPDDALGGEEALLNWWPRTQQEPTE